MKNSNSSMADHSKLTGNPVNFRFTATQSLPPQVRSAFSEGREECASLLFEQPSAGISWLLELPGSVKTLSKL